jgi:hypothetical protein
VTHLVLNQYRQGSGYKDIIGRLYHFPLRYLKRFSELPCQFVYYEPREGGDQVYFGAGRVSAVYEDTEDVDHAYAEIGSYKAFSAEVNFYSGPEGRTWEDSKAMRNSVREIGGQLFSGILSAGGFIPSVTPPSEADESVSESLARELVSYPGPGMRTPAMLRRIRRIIESYERPSAVTNYLKRTRGDRCQLCGIQGFLKRDGNRYCEVHHLFHLADDPPAECLSPRFLIILCASCHRRMHYARVGTPVASANGWTVMIDGQLSTFVTT